MSIYVRAFVYIRTSNYSCQSQFLLFRRVNIVPIFRIGIQNPSQKINEIPTARDEIAIVFSDYEKNIMCTYVHCLYNDRSVKFGVVFDWKK